MKRCTVILLACLILLSGSCENGSTVEGRLRVGVVYGLAGSADKSFNEAIKFGVGGLAASERLSYQWREPRTAVEMESLARELARSGMDVILFAGDPAYLEDVAADYPEVRFILVGGELEAPNVHALSFQNRQAAAAVGAIAALKAEGHRLGFIGNLDDRDTRRVISGYQEGARLVNPDVVFFIDFVNSPSPADGDAERARQLAERQFDRGVEVIFSYCGRDIETLAKVAAERGGYIIGSDLNQNWIEKGHVLTSMMRNVSNAVREALSAATGESFTPGLEIVPLGGYEGLGYFVDEINEPLLPKRSREIVEAVLESLETGQPLPPELLAPEKPVSAPEPLPA